jgi:tetratricopeptide (TPR) repeat protein
LGIVYTRRKAWKDARVVFNKCVKECQTMNAWMNLGLSLLRIGDLPEAEDAFTQANILDTTNPDIWSYIAILCLTSGGQQKAVQAEHALKQAFSFKVTNAEILEELADLYAKFEDEKYHHLAITCYTKALESDQENGAVWQKYADLLSTKDENRPQAIDHYKKALELIEGETNKGKIALILQELLKLEGREDEIKALEEYIHLS